MIYIKRRKTALAVIAIVIVAILLCSVLYVYTDFLRQKPVKEEIVPAKEIDKRISPLENQGLILEINRIRHRDLLDKLTTFGTSWRNKPSFYFISNVDNLEYVSKDDSPDKNLVYTTWDTMFQENKVMRDVGEEQETSEITLTIVERVKKGILGRRYDDIERDSFHVTYDYRTGRWTGDDFIKDEDGYGHYLGETFEIWFDIYQTDKDGDGIPYWTEVNVLNTDPWVDDSNYDPDGDGIPTAWEWKWGYDPHVWDDHERLDPDIDGIENIEEYQMEKWFADPYAQDIYLEADGMKQEGLLDPEHFLWEESQQLLIERFARHGMNMYVDAGWPDGPINGGGEILDRYGASSQDSGMILRYYNNHFADERKGIFRYLVTGWGQPAFNHPAKFNRYDAIHTVNNFRLNFLFKAYTPRVQRLVLAALVQHELGHSFGITPWSFEGCDNLSYYEDEAQFLEEWGNYYSCMNYYYLNQMQKGLFFDLTDYSDGSRGYHDQNDWEVLYLPAFQTESRVIEEVFFEPPCVDKVVGEELFFKPSGWNYSNDLTNQYEKMMGDWSPLEPIKVDWYVYEKIDSALFLSNRTIRIYAKSRVPFSEWILSQEAHLDDEGNIHLATNI